MAFDPRWLPPQLPSQLSSQPPNLNANHQQPLPYYNFAYPNPTSESTATYPAEVTLAQQHYFYPHGAEASGIRSASVANAGQYYYRGESVPEISPITSMYMVPPHIIPQERNNRYKYKAKPKKFKREAKIVQPSLPCAVCKINCDTQAVLDCHKQGKQHKKNLQKLKDAITPKPERKEPEKSEAEKTAPEEILERLKSKAQPIHCKVCDIYCNTEEVLRLHEAGKKHKKMAAEPNAEGDKETKLNLIGEPAYCQICSVLCTSREDLTNHRQGKNHKKKLELQAIGTSKPGDENYKQMIRKAAEENSALGKRKVPDERHIQSMRCDLCNVEVNSRIVYDSHIAGSKHAAAVKKLLGQQQQEVKAAADEENAQC